MRFVLVILCLVVLSVSVSTTTVITKYVEKNHNLPSLGSSSYSAIKRCEIKDNKGKVFVFLPREERSEKLSKFSSINNMRPCEIGIYKLVEEDEGIWEFRMIKIENDKEVREIKFYDIKVRETIQEASMFPASYIEVHPNRQILMNLVGNFDGVTSCKLMNLHDELEYDIGSNKLEGVTLNGKCGFKMTAKKHYGGHWKLVADYENKTTISGKFSIKILGAGDLEPNATHYYFKRGEEGNIIGGVETAKFCILENPHGIKLPVENGQCKFKISSVSDYDYGIWKANYGLNDVEYLIQQIIYVHPHHDYDIPPPNSSVTHSPNGDVNLLCQVQDVTLNFCTFVKPDGKILHMSPAVSTSKYDYYGNVTGAEKSGIIDCGVTIHNPTSEDWGTWRCMINYNTIRSTNVGKSIGKILKVFSPNTTEIKPDASATNVVVKQGDSFKVKCTADKVLSYCWFKSPNGTVHSVFKNREVKYPELTYEGIGYELGDCTARIHNASEEHIGKWTCHMGVQNGPELETNFKVTLKDSHLMAVHDTVWIQSGSSPTYLTCRTLPDSNKVIESCRWVTPQGHGIYVINDQRYYTESHFNFCRLQIYHSSYSDVGEWHCYVRFVEAPKEVSARIFVGYRSQGILGFISNTMLLGLVVITTLCVFIVVMYKRKQAIAEYDNKTILEKPPKFP